MSLEPSPRRNDYIGDGSTSIYDYDFPIDDKSELLLKTLSTTYVETTLVVDVDYSVDGEGDAEGGQITLLLADLPTGVELAILGRRPIEQQNNIGNNGPFRPDIIEDEFDKLTIVDQEQQEQIGRSLKLPDSISADDFDSTLPAEIINPANAGKSLIINLGSNGIDIGDSSGGGGGGSLGTYQNIDSNTDLSSAFYNNFCDVTGGSITTTLPDASLNPGVDIFVKNTSFGSVNTVTVDSDGGDIEGGSSDVLAAAEGRLYSSNATDWFVKF